MTGEKFVRSIDPFSPFPSSITKARRSLGLRGCSHEGVRGGCGGGPDGGNFLGGGSCAAMGSARKVPQQAAVGDPHGSTPSTPGCSLKLIFIIIFIL